MQIVQALMMVFGCLIKIDSFRDKISDAMPARFFPFEIDIPVGNPIG